MDGPTNAHLRTAGYAIALLDFLQVIPALYVLYSQAWKSLSDRPTASLLLFLRCSNAIAFITSAAGFVSTSFTPASCSRYHLVPIVFQIFSGWATEIVLIFKISTLTRKSLGVLGSLSLLAFFSFPLQIFGTLYLRKSVFANGGCSSLVKTQWGYYDSGLLYFASHLAFDVYALLVSAAIAVTHGRRTPLEPLFRVLTIHGVPHIAVIALSDLLCTLASLNVRVVQGLGSTLPIAVIFIMTQHLALSTTEAMSYGSCGKGALTHRDLGSTDYYAEDRRPQHQSSRIELIGVRDGVEIQRNTIVSSGSIHHKEDEWYALEMTPKLAPPPHSRGGSRSRSIEGGDEDDQSVQAHSLDSRFRFPRRPPPVVRYGKAT
ncbi:hypothetical protein FRB95_003945 [Tulasnella sp. JGI-2019a]|nr:hypothetical protein FRB93_001916 [Tulasnella sp. JGI-2019a]KAG9030439.1 hypothetical protein FRB95_003945 [Tulasnella sp. JGI-2019a]